MSAKNPLSFMSGTVQNRELFRVVAQVDELKEKGATDSRLMKWSRGERKWYSYRLAWHATRIVCMERPEFRIVAIGPSGIVYVGNGLTNAEEHVDDSNEGPKRRGDMRDINLVGDTVFAVGMGRQVYRRVRDGQWQHEDQGVVARRGVSTVCGFNSIHGTSENDLVAVGFAGEIWTRRGGVWTKEGSPTNVVLHKVLVVDGGVTYACGQKGVLLSGSNSVWHEVTHNLQVDNFWGLGWFKGELYVAADAGLYVLRGGKDLEPLDGAVLAGATTRHLQVLDGVLLSVGSKNVLFTEDGANWNEITP